MQDDKIKNKTEWEEKVVSLRRVAKVITGGKRLRFNAIVVVGNKKGMVGMGYGKANEVTDAIRKAKEKAIKNVKKVNLKGTTIPYQITGKYKSAVLLMKPAAPGTGVIAGGAVRPVLELVGIKDILTKSLRSNNSLNLVKATINTLYSLVDINDICEKRGKNIFDIYEKKKD